MAFLLPGDARQRGAERSARLDGGLKEAAHRFMEPQLDSIRHKHQKVFARQREGAARDEELEALELRSLELSQLVAESEQDISPHLRGELVAQLHEHKEALLAVQRDLVHSKSAAERQEAKADATEAALRHRIVDQIYEVQEGKDQTDTGQDSEGLREEIQRLQEDLLQSQMSLVQLRGGGSDISAESEARRAVDQLTAQLEEKHQILELVCQESQVLVRRMQAHTSWTLSIVDSSSPETELVSWLEQAQAELAALQNKLSDSPRREGEHLQRLWTARATALESVIKVNMTRLAKYRTSSEAPVVEQWQLVALRQERDLLAHEAQKMSRQVQQCDLTIAKIKDEKKQLEKKLAESLSPKRSISLDSTSSSPTPKHSHTTCSTPVRTRSARLSSGYSSISSDRGTRRSPPEATDAQIEKWLLPSRSPSKASSPSTSPKSRQSKPQTQTDRDAFWLKRFEAIEQRKSLDDRGSGRA